MISNIQIRTQAREILGTNLFSGSWLYPILLSIILSSISIAVSRLSFISIVVVGMLSMASASYFLGRVRGSSSPKNLGAAIEGIQKNVSGSIIVGVLQTLFIALGTFLFFIPGFIFSISFSMTYHVLNDNPQMKPMEALRESNRLMKGHRVQYFCLLLSFIGWAFVGALLFGIGTLWVNTYMLTAQTVFYEELLKLDGTKDSFERNQADEEQKEQARKNNSTHW